MKSYDLLAAIPGVLGFISAATVVAEEADAASTPSSTIVESGTAFPYVAIAVLFAFLMSGVYFIARETHREGAEKRNRDNA